MNNRNYLFVFICDQGQASDILIHAEEILKLKNLITRLYVKHTGQTAEEIGSFQTKESK